MPSKEPPKYQKVENKMTNVIFLLLNFGIVYHRFVSDTWWWANWLNLICAIICFRALQKDLREVEPQHEGE